MDCLEIFLDKPVMIQLKNPVLAAISAEPVELEGGEVCGCATIAFLKGEPGQPNQPVMAQVLRGSIEMVDETHTVIATLGGDGKTPVRVCVEVSNIASINFCVEHVPYEAPQTPKIITP